jgi:hypothetical protein
LDPVRSTYGYAAKLGKKGKIGKMLAVAREEDHDLG